MPEEFSEHWQQTIEFLKIITEAWPAHLAERGLLSPVGRRNRAILAEAERLATAPPPGPVIVAGVTGSIPATVELMRAVARLPKGAIVLPGLDPYLDEESWQTIVPADASEPGHPEHPQFGLKKLLDRLELKREDVRALGDAKRERGRAGPRRADGRGDAAVGHDCQVVRLHKARQSRKAALRPRRREPHRSPLGAGRGRGRVAHPARGGGDAGSHRRA